MSVVICIIDRAREMYLAADKRAVTQGVADDNYRKIRQLRPNLYMGITGVAALGEAVVAEAKKQDKLGVAGLIDYLDTAISPSSIRLTVTVAGRGDEGNLFLWQKKNDGTIERPDILDTDAVVSVASTAKYDAIYDRLIAELCKREGIEKAIQRTIAFASTIEDSICADYDLVKVSAGEGDESSAV